MICSLTRAKGLTKVLFGFSNNKIHVFPYLMGGLPTSQYFTDKKAQQFHHEMFTNDIDKTFTSLYQNYLKALEEKDFKFLNEHVDKRLIADLNDHFPSVTVENKDAPIEIAVQSNLLIGNIGFNRDYHASQMKFKKTSPKYQQVLSYYESFSMDPNKISKVVRLFSTKVYFKSALKLVKQKKSKDEVSPKQSLNEEIHVVQFEAETRSSRFKMVLNMLAIKLLNFRNKQKQKERMMRFLIGASPISAWKIADVDKILHGNLPKPVEEYSDPELIRRQIQNQKK